MLKLWFLISKVTLFYIHIVITSGGIENASPDMVAHQTIRYENTAIQRILPIKVIGKKFLIDDRRVSGRVIAIGKIKGKNRT